jgi:hypothetical protein
MVARKYMTGVDKMTREQFTKLKNDFVTLMARHEDLTGPEICACAYVASIALSRKPQTEFKEKGLRDCQYMEEYTPSQFWDSLQKRID